VAGVDAVLRGGFIALSKNNLLYWKDLVSDVRQLSTSSRSHQQLSSSPQPWR